MEQLQKSVFLDLSMLCSVKFFKYSFCNKILMKKVIEVVESLNTSINSFNPHANGHQIMHYHRSRTHTRSFVRTHVFPYALIPNRNFISVNRFEHENFTLKLPIRIAYIVSGIVLISPFQTSISCHKSLMYATPSTHNALKVRVFNDFACRFFNHLNCSVRWSMELVRPK